MNKDDDELGEYDDEWYEDWYDDDSEGSERSAETSVDDNGLLPCPFCGSPVDYYTRDAETGSYLIAPYTEYVIKCPNMDCPVEWEVARRTYQEAKEDWNTRYKEKNMSEDLSKIREEYADLENKLAAAWLESNKLKDRMSELREKLNELDEYKKQYIVRVYQEVYFDFEVDAFDEDAAVKVATESAPYEDMEICSYFASTPPRLKVVCLKADYKEEMEKNDG